MEFRLLGQVEAWHDGQRIELGGRKPRRLLAALLVDANQVVSTDRLVDVVWDDEPAATAHNLVSSYVHHLRTAFAASGVGDQISLITRRPGYLARLDTDQVDLHRFRRLLDSARSAGDDQVRVNFLRHALDLWHGEPLADLDSRWLRNHVCARLEESRLDAIEELVEIELRLGASVRKIDELRELCALNPARERLATLLIRALNAAGRPAEALQIYPRLRRRMVDELGVEPTHLLRDAHHAVLLGEAAPAADTRQDTRQRIGQEQWPDARPGSPDGPRPSAPPDAQPAGPPPAPAPPAFPPNAAPPTAGPPRAGAPAPLALPDYAGLSPREKEALAEALLDVDGMRQRDRRDRYLLTLERELGHHLPFFRQESDRADVWGLVGVCLSHTGALHALVRILERSEPDTTAMRALAELTDRLVPVPLLEPAERQQLRRLVGGLSCYGIPAMYRAAVGPAARPLTRDPIDLLAVLGDLEEATATPDGMPPLLPFLERLAHQVGDPHAGRIRTWVDRVATRLGYTSTELREVRAVVASAADVRPERAYLVIQLQPDGVDPERYLLSVWIQQDGQVADPVHRDDEPRGLPEIRTKLDELLTQTPEITGGDFREMIVEFILPRPLLGHEVDQWQVGLALGFPRRLGIDHPVLVRSYERMRNRAMHHHWRRKGEWLRGYGHRPDPDAVYWIMSPGETHPEALLSELILDARPICVVLGFVPPPDRQLGQDELATALHAGAPVMLWCRATREARRLRAELAGLLEDRPLRELPQSVLRLRREAVRAECPADHLGLHLTVLWDDPQRLPEPQGRLKAPA